MTKAPLKVGDRVKILADEIQPQYVGKTGKIKKIFQTFSEKCDCVCLYRIEVDGEALRGVACRDDLEKL